MQNASTTNIGDMGDDPVMALAAARPTGACLSAASQQAATRINDFIWQSSGTSNSYMLLTSAGRVIVNCGLGFEALTHKRLFDAVCPGPTPWIITTQGHVDHVGGVNRFRAPETRYLAQRNQPLCQCDDARIAERRQSQSYIWFQEVIDHALRIADAHPEALIQDIPVPDLTFDEHHALRVGELDLELIAVPGGETIDSCLVWLPQYRILFCGNLFGPFFPHFPNFNTIRGDKYRDVTRYLDSTAKVLELAPELLITGHGAPIEGAPLIAQCVTRLRDAVSYVHDETLKGINAGADVFQLMRDIRLPPQLRVGEAYGRVAWCVRTIWESYLGWFHAQATHELYPTQPRDLYADLARLAGPQALLGLAREKLATDPAASTLLCDMALAGSGDGASAADAWRLHIEAHRRLLDEAAARDNFWLSGWLRHQIARAERALEELADGASSVAPRRGAVAELFGKLPAHFRPAAAVGVDATIQFNVSDGSVWTVIVRDQACHVEREAAPRPDCIIHIGEKELVGLMCGTLSPLRAAFGGNIRLEGDKLQARLLDKVFERNIRLDDAAPAASERKLSANAIRIDDLRAPRLDVLQRVARAGARLAPGRTIFSEAAVLDAARRRTGMNDFGHDDFRERLGLLLADYAADAGMSALGQRVVFADLVRYASNRLLIQDRLKRHPEILDEQIVAPIIVAGLPRSGTTHLLNLLASDTRFRSLPLWLSQEPVPLPGDARLKALLRSDPRHVRSALRWAGMRHVVPHLAAMHPMEPDHIHEELELMGPDFASFLFEWTGLVPRYRAHAKAADQTPHYAYMKNALKLLQWRQPAKRWVLKCPQHLEQLPLLLRTFPDATVVVTHRDPLAVIQSTATMLAYSHRMSRMTVDAPAVARYWIERIEHLLRAAVRDRDVLPEAQSLDCPFHVFMADDLGMIGKIYAMAGVDMTASARAELQRYIDDHPRGRNGQVIYDLHGDFDVDVPALYERFAFYFERFPVKRELV